MGTFILILVLSVSYLLGSIILRLNEKNGKSASYVNLGLHFLLAMVVITIIFRINK